MGAASAASTMTHLVPRDLGSSDPVVAVGKHVVAL
jgi:hypothetical protein